MSQSPRYPQGRGKDERRIARRHNVLAAIAVALDKSLAWLEPIEDSLELLGFDVVDMQLCYFMSMLEGGLEAKRERAAERSRDNVPNGPKH